MASRSSASLVCRILLFGVVGWVLSASAARAADWYVDQSYSDCDNATGGPTDPFCKIRQAVKAAADGDVIHIAPGNYAEHLLIGKSLTLIGTEGQDLTEVDGSDDGPVVLITAGNTVTLRGLTVQRGRSTSHGGGIYVSRSDLTLEFCTVRSCTAEAVDVSEVYGGAIFLDGSDLQASDCRIYDCAALGLRRGSHGIGGGIGGQASTATLSRTAICGNRAQGTAESRDWPGEALGGGIGFDSGSVTLVECVLNGNRAVGEALRREYAPARGGAVELGTGTLRLERSIVCGNEVVHGDTGGLRSNSMFVTNSLVVGNLAVSRNVDSLGGMSSWGANSVLHSTVADNWAREFGGGMSARDPQVDHSIFWGNHARIAPQLGAGGSNGLVRYSDLQGGEQDVYGPVQWGPGNFDEVPWDERDRIAGFWSEAAIYSPSDGTLRLRDQRGNWPPGAFTGRLVRPVVEPSFASHRQLLILSNSADELVV